MLIKYWLIFVDFKGSEMNTIMFPKSLNNFTLTPNNDSGTRKPFNRFDLVQSTFDPKMLGELGTYLPGLFYFKYYNTK